MRKKNITVRDIAREANVSVATVSRFINNKGVLSEETAAKVQFVIEKYNFIPNELARSLYTKKSKMLGFVVPDITNGFYSQLCLEVEKSAVELGYNVFLCNSMNDRKLESLYLEKLAERQVDGIILAGGRINDTINNPEHIDEMKKILPHVPVVMINGKMDGVESYRVFSDEKEAVFKMLQYLTNLGHRKIGLIGGSSGITSFDIKKDAFLEAADKMKFVYKDQWIIEGGYSIEGGIVSMSKLLQNAEMPSAVIAINDLVAAGALKVCNKQRVRIPDELSIIGFDNIDLCKVTKPELTTMAHPYEKLGKKAVEAVNKLVNGEIPELEISLDTELVIRDSCRRI
ncbi:LacI family DNA-binding transcriptional regulator [Clostridium sp. 19966]|uniref:LacI family DNA-binding transcriptional regulator n=1 Tax=Clostridium sp. 19966 TaxID=2768166 RepID=UPI0028E0551F|nr:LacI family DNA-binding transcriptional regulator [Clostridium sp. 19966]MDT8715959.1 LacI family DNA-binding transcriptional regulator [Clostridium sp. 19966]